MIFHPTSLFLLSSSVYLSTKSTLAQNTDPCLSTGQSLNVAFRTKFNEVMLDPTLSNQKHTFTICPGSEIRVGTDNPNNAAVTTPISIPLLNATVQCGEDGSSENSCTFLGIGGSIFNVRHPSYFGVANENATLQHEFRGITFDEYDGDGVSVATSKDSVVIFEDCVWRTSDLNQYQGVSATGTGLRVTSGTAIVRNSKIWNPTKPTNDFLASDNRVILATGPSPWGGGTNTEGSGNILIENLFTTNIRFRRHSSSINWKRTGSILEATNGGTLVVSDSNFTDNAADIVKVTGNNCTLIMNNVYFNKNDSPIVALSGASTAALESLHFIQNNFPDFPYSAIRFEAEVSNGVIFRPVAELKDMLFDGNYNMQHGVESTSSNLLLEDSLLTKNIHPYGGLRSEASLFQSTGSGHAVIRNTIFLDNDLYLTYIEASRVELENVCVTGGEVMLAPFYLGSYNATNVFVDNVTATHCGDVNVVAERITEYCLSLSNDISQCGPCEPLVGSSLECFSGLSTNTPEASSPPVETEDTAASSPTNISVSSPAGNADQGTKVPDTTDTPVSSPNVPPNSESQDGASATEDASSDAGSTDESPPSSASGSRGSSDVILFLAAKLILVLLFVLNFFM